MDKPITIELSSLPGLETAQALYGSISVESASYDDSVVSVMVYVYDLVPPSALGI